MIDFISNSFILSTLSSLLSSVREFGYTNLLATLATASIAYRLAHALLLSSLRDVPGPFLARLTGKRAELLAGMGRQAAEAIKDYETYGDIYVYQPNAVSISNPEDIRTVLATHSFRKTDLYRGVDFVDIENIVSTANPELASLRRRQLGPYLNHSFLASLEDTILKYGTLAIKKKWDRLLEESGGNTAVVNYNKDFLYSTFDVIGALVFGREFGALANDDKTAPKWVAMSTVFLGARANFPLLRVFPFSLLLKPWGDQYMQIVKYGGDCINHRKQLLQSLSSAGDKKPNDLLQGLIDAADPESKQKMSPVELHSESMVMLLAGSETTAGSLTWITHMLSLYPAHYKRAVDEIRSQFGKDHLIRYSEGRKNLPFLEACIYEALRLTAVTGGQWPRKVPKEGITIRGHFIPGGSEINLNYAGAGIHKETWTNPYLFNPERFLDNEEAKKNVFAFSFGVRMCPGRNLAWIEMITMLANLLKDYDFKLPSGYKNRGPDVLDERGNPKLMDYLHFFVRVPKRPEQDCLLEITKRP